MRCLHNTLHARCRQKDKETVLYDHQIRILPQERIFIHQKSSDPKKFAIKEKLDKIDLSNPVSNKSTPKEDWFGEMFSTFLTRKKGQNNSCTLHRGFPFIIQLLIPKPVISIIYLENRNCSFAVPRSPSNRPTLRSFALGCFSRLCCVALKRRGNVKMYSFGLHVFLQENEATSGLRNVV